MAGLKAVVRGLSGILAFIGRALGGLLRLLLGNVRWTPPQWLAWSWSRGLAGCHGLTGWLRSNRFVALVDPSTGMRDFDTLEVLARYRREVPSTEPLSFGVWARVDQAGRVALGDDIRVLDD